VRQFVQRARPKPLTIIRFARDLPAGEEHRLRGSAIPGERLVSLVDPSSNSLTTNFAFFFVGAIAIWLAGAKLEGYVDEIAVLTGIGKAFLGMMLLAAATSLPEVGTTVTATWSGDTSMAVHNLLGGVVLQTAILAIADLAMGRRALSFASPHFSLLIQAVGLVFVLAVVLAGIPAAKYVSRQMPSMETIAVVVWLLSILGVYLVLAYLTYAAQGRPRWRPLDHDEASNGKADNPSSDSRPQRSLATVGAYFAIGSLVVLVAGWIVATTGGALARQTGLGSSFFGFTLVAAATSLPEISTTVSSARAGRYETAFGNIFGSNALCAALLVLVGLIAGGSALVESLTASTQFAAAMGIFLTCIYLWGLLERQDRTIWMFGWDSAAVVLFAVVGNVIVYWLN
jgi:cation:H+ antiporter